MKKWFHTLFLPWQRKIPLESAAAGLAALLLVLVWPGRRHTIQAAWAAVSLKPDEETNVIKAEKTARTTFAAPTPSHSALAETPEPPEPPVPEELAVAEKAGALPKSGATQSVSSAEQREAAPPINEPAALIEDKNAATPADTTEDGTNNDAQADSAAGNSQVTPRQKSLLRNLGFRPEARRSGAVFILKADPDQLDSLRLRLQAAGLAKRSRTRKLAASDSVLLEFR